MFKRAAWLVFSLSTTGAAHATAWEPRLDRELPSLVTLYKELHAAPELSHQERHTAARLAAELRPLGYTVTERVGKYPNPQWVGYGVVAVLKNGKGPTVLIRADMDALPVEEKTGLPYASHVRSTDDAGLDVPVMHACGHDIHVASLIGTARLLAALRDHWHGTLVLVGQPSEEKADGARALLADGLYTRFPRPDAALALHDFSDLRAGTVGYISGYMLAGANSVDVTLRGRGGHGAYPHMTKDPIVMAAEFILALQTIVSRENSPTDPAVVTVGSIHGGTKYNIIPDEVKLQLTVRTYKPEVRQRILDAIARIANGIASMNGLPAERAPLVKVSPTEVTAPVYNDPALTERLVTSLRRTLGAQRLVQLEPVMGGEDFGAYGLEDRRIPTLLFRVGAIDPERMDKARSGGAALPSLHSSEFWPAPEATIRTGVQAMTAMALELLGKP